MDRLDENWLTDGLIDFEYKKYILLAYLKTVKDNFNDKKLFPFMSDLIFHYRNLKLVREKKEIIVENFPKEITKADFKNLKLSYKKLIEDDEIMKELDSIIDFSTNKIKNRLNEGKEIYDYLEKHIEIHPVGLTPINSDEGYIFIGEKSNNTYSIFRYLITIFENSVDRFRAVNFQYLGTFKKMIVETYESIKKNLINNYRELPNPATYLMLSSFEIPFDETYLPMAKRMLVQYLETNSR